LVSYIGVDPHFKYIVKTYVQEDKRKVVRDRWIEEGLAVARKRLAGLATPTMVIDIESEDGEEFAFSVEGSGPRYTDLAIVQKRLIPLKDIMLERLRAGDVEGAKGLIDEYKQLFIRIFRRGAIDLDYGDPLGNYGMDPETGRLYIFDLGELSSGVDAAHGFEDDLDYINEYIADTLREEIGTEIADYYKENEFVESDFYGENNEFLFGVDYDPAKSDEHMMCFPLSEAEVRQLFYTHSAAGVKGRPQFTDDKEIGVPYSARFYKTPKDRINTRNVGKKEAPDRIDKNAATPGM
ncbi:MAG: hypothetical protein WC419_04570, partial [Candidatus Omnitrophota bacterium]